MTPEIKEMIEYAAKAMGYEGVWSDEEQAFIHSWDKEFNAYQSKFNPLTPADSHALMCELEVDVSWSTKKQNINCVVYIPVLDESIGVGEPYGDDKSAACRLPSWWTD